MVMTTDSSVSNGPDQSGTTADQSGTSANQSGTGTPPWFTAAIADRPEHRDVEVEGVRVHLRCWGKPGTKGVVLVHGGSAHSGWWDHIGPLLAASHRVVALDLTGHGDSGVRDGYPLTTWAAEVLAAAEAGGIAGHPYVVGHSMGGWVTSAVGGIHADSVSGIVIIDSPLLDEPPEEVIIRQLSRKARVYATQDEICARFRTEPAQDVLLPYVAAHVAVESVRHTDAGWMWKFDPEMFRKRHERRELIHVRDLLSNVRTPTVYIRCEQGIVPPEVAQEIVSLFTPPAVVVELALAGHHPMMDQPLALVATLRTALAHWDSML
jgi:pimeloyl-ACP methyl ester carboxylesterase